MMTKNILTGAALVLASALSFSAQAAIIPVGPQNDVAVSTVEGEWGWSQCWSGVYGQSGESISSILAGCQGDYLMMAAKHVNSDSFEVVAAALYEDVTFNTGNGNVGHVANGTQWYFSESYSWGFAGADDVLMRSSCDFGDGGGSISNNPDRDRLCWHTNGGNLAGGWRAGNNAHLNGTQDWMRYLYVANRVDVPVPATLGLLGLALLGLRLRRKA